MLKKLSFLLILFSLVGVLLGCQSSDPEFSFTGVIEELHGDGAIVLIEEGEILASGDRVSVNLAVAEELTFEVGDRIKVGYSGPVQEKYPLGIQTESVEKIE